MKIEINYFKNSINYSFLSIDIEILIVRAYYNFFFIENNNSKNTINVILIVF